jgi:hypothetical protein
MAKIKVTLQEARRSTLGKSYRVVALVNTLEPKIGSLLSDKEAAQLIDDATAGRLEVNVKAAVD